MPRVAYLASQVEKSLNAPVAFVSHAVSVVDFVSEPCRNGRDGKRALVKLL
jgi:hypothetical protein